MKRGFTLIEMLVALVVIATTGILVSTSVGNISSQTHQLERRQLAHWVLENHVTRLRLTQRQNNAALPTGRDVERADMAGETWEIRTEIKSTAHPWLRRAEVSVYLIGEGGEPVGPLDQQASFLGRY